MPRVPSPKRLRFIADHYSGGMYSEVHHSYLAYPVGCQPWFGVPPLGGPNRVNAGLQTEMGALASRFVNQPDRQDSYFRYTLDEASFLKYSFKSTDEELADFARKVDDVSTLT